MSSTKHCRSFMPSYENKTGLTTSRLPESKLASLERYLKSKAYSNSIIRDRESFNSRKVQEGKARKQRGKTKESDQKREKEEVLCQNGQLGGGTPRVLLNTMWWLLTQQFWPTRATRKPPNESWRFHYTTRWRRKRISNFCRRSN